MKLKKFVSDTGGSTRDFSQIDPRLLQVRPDFNIRDLTTAAARERLDVLKAQIKAEGVLEPLEIEFDGETPWINEGHRRHIVVMELIEEGHDFKTIPCIQERNNIKDDKRTLHLLMRKKENYEPLEYAKGLQRMVDVYGWERGALATSLGEPKANIDRYLAMLGMTEEVQEQVRDGVVSATEALKVTRETRDAKTDPKFAAELIAAAAEEQRRLGKKGRATPKAVKRVSERSKPKSDPPKPEPEISEDEKRARAEALGDAKARERAELPSALAATSETEPERTLPFTAEAPMAPDAATTLREHDAELAEKYDLPPAAFKPPQSRPQPHMRTDELLLEFISVDAATLASMYARLVKENDEARAEGEAGLARWHLFKAADHVGHCRFEEWESAKARSELAEVA